MKAFKGCINKDCKAYKKVKYKKEDQFCKACGQPLQFVCADCWKQLDSDDSRLCENCSLEREQKKKQKLDKAADLGKKAVAVVPAVIAFGAQCGINKDMVAKVGKKAVDVVMKK